MGGNAIFYTTESHTSYDIRSWGEQIISGALVNDCDPATNMIYQTLRVFFALTYLLPSEKKYKMLLRDSPREI